VKEVVRESPCDADDAFHPLCVSPKVSPVVLSYAQPPSPQVMQFLNPAYFEIPARLLNSTRDSHP
jgi:hypothetical protein